MTPDQAHMLERNPYHFLRLSVVLFGDGSCVDGAVLQLFNCFTVCQEYIIPEIEK